MSVGYPVTKSVIDNGAGSLMIQLRDNLAQVKRFNAFLGQAAQADAALIALGYTQAEVTSLKAAFTVLDQFRQCWEGTLAIPSPVNIQGYILPFISTS